MYTVHRCGLPRSRDVSLPCMWGQRQAVAITSLANPKLPLSDQPKIQYVLYCTYLPSRVHTTRRHFDISTLSAHDFRSDTYYIILVKIFLWTSISAQPAVFFGNSQDCCRHYLDIMRTLPRSSAVLSPLSTTTSIRSRISSRCFHCSSRLWAIAHPVTAHGPPPKAPVPAPGFGEPVEQRKKQAELIQEGKEAPTQPSKPSTTIRKRFWKDVHVKETPGTFPPFTLHCSHPSFFQEPT